MIRVLRAVDHRVMPWKNGGGITTEIAAHPDGAGLDAFEWRVSMARVESNGPFSSFPDIDRNLTVLEGDGIILAVQGRMPVELLAKSAPMGFPADVPTTAQLLGGPITDLNVMVRRGRFHSEVHRISLNGATDLETDADTTFLVCNNGEASLRVANQDVRLAPKDCLRLDRQQASIAVKPDPEAELLVVELFRLA